MNDERRATRKGSPPIKVYVRPDERALIEENARCAGLSIARYLREVGQGYQVKGVMDYQYVRELVRVNGDLGRLGGLLKLWLSDDMRTAGLTEATILALLSKIEALQDEMTQLMWSIVKPGTKP
ncbi:conjugal transfer transcriptional regulator TraJ [Achromobacter xylosoxidans]|uniref:conjugal transfer transcriptional regulator TraJ n=1 Tax=Alcaligenes xylosoxydans xylosoxydans TaxID=85698 RepID=UPI0029303AA1|nr:conjugal transfer transcriptional regulator TraJ [Achromobacter xylosoxidans]WOB76274.1 conjugal transfer transcriptional regulator TraJ [Achromobacter xylosoxidans]